MIVVNRFRVTVYEAAAFRTDLEAARSLLADRPGHVEGRIGRNVDEPDLWVLVTVWADVGAYRRAISSYEAKLYVVPLLSRALDEPSAYESVEPGAVLNTASTRSLG